MSPLHTGTTIYSALICSTISLYPRSTTKTNRNIYFKMRSPGLALLAIAGSALAIPAQPKNDIGPFQILVDIDGKNSTVSAVNGKLYANYQSQNAVCEGSEQDFATFEFRGTQLLLYSKADKRQQLYGFPGEMRMSLSTENYES